MPDGSRNKVQVMDMVVDKDSGEVVPLNDITGLEFEVYSDIGASFANQKEETLDRLAEMSQEIAGTDPTMHKMLLLKRMSLMDGVDFDSERKWARNQLILMGVEEPKDEEEEALLAQQAQQGQQPDAAMVLAQAEQGKAQAQQMKAQTDMAKAQADIQNNNAQTQIDGFKAQTDRMNMQVDAQKVGADIDYTRTKTLGQQIDNITKGVNPLRGNIA